QHRDGFVSFFRPAAPLPVGGTDRWCRLDQRLQGHQSGCLAGLVGRHGRSAYPAGRRSGQGRGFHAAGGGGACQGARRYCFRGGRGDHRRGIGEPGGSAPGRQPCGCRRAGGGTRPGWRHGVAVTRLRQPRSVCRLCAARRGLHGRRAGAGGMMILPAQLRLPRVMPDRTLLIALATLLFIGLVMVASSSIAEADRQIGNPLYYFNRQALYALLGLSAALAVVHVPMQYWQSNRFPLLGLGLFLLVLVRVPGSGDEVNGWRRWIGLGPISMQASEPARLCLLLYVAGYASRRQLALVSSWGGLLRPMLFMLLASGLLLMEPDYGGAAVLIAIAGMVLFLAGARLLPLVTLALGAVASLALLAMISPYRLQRLTSFTD